MSIECYGFRLTNYPELRVRHSRISGYPITQCGDTDSVRLVKLVYRSHGVAAVSLWGDSDLRMNASPVLLRPLLAYCTEVLDCTSPLFPHTFLLNVNSLDSRSDASQNSLPTTNSSSILKSIWTYGIQLWGTTSQTSKF
jgi:hypothetical protein